MTGLQDDLKDLVVESIHLVRRSAPTKLETALDFLSAMHRMTLPQNPLAVIAQHLASCGPNDRILHALTLALQSWDHQEGQWTAGTEAYSIPRRTLVLRALGFPLKADAILNERILRFTGTDLTIVISKEHEPWYAARRNKTSSFYWDHYARQLAAPIGKWSSKAVSVLDKSIDDVISRVSDPTRPAAYAVKGLVMGYVQSGKTSHFSGLITKAADAGYRLIIVLAGTLDILREQTQRRIDKEIIGQELLGPDEYGGDGDWETFVSHGGRPSHLGSFDWERLTNSEDDYQALSRHLTLLEFASADRSKPFNHPDNLRSAPAKIAVIKKIPARLNRLCKDLESLAKLRNSLLHVPTLVIDDESDQASINTIDQMKQGERGKRTGTNKAIVRLLSLLPRAQYIGYTATPFANVFIDPLDAEDLFPKDFIVSLPRPEGYMGVSDFFDFDTQYEDKDFRGNQNAFVRPVEGLDEHADNLPRAIDSFVLSGAIKLYRQKASPETYSYRHHTMLVHNAATRLVHDEDRAVVDRIFKNGARYQSKAGRDALESLFASDFSPVSAAQAPHDLMPGTFEELSPFVSQCLSRVCSDKAIRVVNGEGKNRDDTPDFDANATWGILVGGTKLSRGYTIEGLTTSYYRRAAGAGDTLMQMERWFGFRQGYRDLVRLFISRRERKGSTTIDVYEAFGAVCRDEEALRNDLRKYSERGLKPIQVPPLVLQHLPKLPPTSRNKMFNAEIREKNFAGDWTEKTSAPTSATPVAHNLEITSTLLGGINLEKEYFAFTNADGDARAFGVRIGKVDGASIAKFLELYHWAGGKKAVALEVDYIRRSMADGELKRWLVLLPQVRGQLYDGLPVAAPIERARVSENRFGVYSEPRHREAAAALAGVKLPAECNDALTSRLSDPHPVLVLYLVRERSGASSDISVGFGIQYPGVKVGHDILWTVRDTTRADEAVVDG